MEALKQFMLTFCSGYTISSNERVMDPYLREVMTPLVDAVESDVLNNLFFIKRGKCPELKPLMVLAHRDEIGGVVTGIRPDGFLEIEGIGGINPLTYVGRRVKVFGNERLEGLIGLCPNDFTSEASRKNKVTMQKLLIDLMRPYDEVKNLVMPGHVFAVSNEAKLIDEDLIVARALDDKAGVGVVYQMMLDLKDETFNRDLIFALTAQEELGIRGAQIVSEQYSPLAVIAIDVGFAKTPGLKDKEALDLVDGVGVGIGALCHKGLNDHLFKLAEKEKIKVQKDFFPDYTGCDADAIVNAAGGVPTVTISVPSRYMHSCIEIASLKNIRQTSFLLSRLIESLQTQKEVGLCL